MSNGIADIKSKKLMITKDTEDTEFVEASTKAIAVIKIYSSIKNYKPNSGGKYVKVGRTKTR